MIIYKNYLFFFLVSLPFSIVVILSLSLFCNCLCRISFDLPVVGLLFAAMDLKKIKSPGDPDNGLTCNRVIQDIYELNKNVWYRLHKEIPKL